MLEQIQYQDKNAFISMLTGFSRQRAALLLDRSLSDIWKISDILESERFRDWIWIDQVPSNPTEKTVSDAISRVRGRDVERIIAVGGGSSIDLAKGISALYSQEDILSAILTKAYLAQQGCPLPIVAVPTTAGTGSEVTKWATIWGVSDGKKYSIEAPWLVPEQVWLVPELTKSLPSRVTLSTGLDALSHAMEAYWAKASNPLIKSLSAQSVGMIMQYLPQALSSPENTVFRQSMLTASLLAGFAFSGTRTTACHSISYPMTSLFGIDHGFAASMTLAAVAEINCGAVDCSELLTFFFPFGGIQNWLDFVSAGIARLRLSHFGVGKPDIAVIVENAFTGGRIDNNPVLFTPDIVRDILEAIYE